MPEYRQGLTVRQALAAAEAGLLHPDLTAAECRVLALQLGAHVFLHAASSCLFSLADRLAQRQEIRQHAGFGFRAQDREWQAAWGSALAEIRSEIAELEEVAHAA